MLINIVYFLSLDFEHCLAIAYLASDLREKFILLRIDDLNLNHTIQDHIKSVAHVTYPEHCLILANLAQFEALEDLNHAVSMEFPLTKEWDLRHILRDLINLVGLGFSFLPLQDF